MFAPYYRQLATQEPLAADELTFTTPIDAEASDIGMDTIARIAIVKP
jgi:hypothetical protein